MSVEYAKQRTQFGRVIGSYQAIKHKLADVLIAVELARPLVFGAALSRWADNTPHAARRQRRQAASDAALLGAHRFADAWRHRLHRRTRPVALVAACAGAPFGLG